MVKENLILLGLMGSYSVGTNTEESDKDYMGVVLGHEDVYIGLDWWGDQGTKQTKNTSSDVPEEYTYYELRKFLRLCQNFNPNVIPLLWLEPKHYLIKNWVGDLLIANRKVFNSKIAISSFCGYAYGQMKKMGEPNAPTGQMGAKRKELRAKFGYDTKYAYHLVRLARMLVEFLITDGKLLNVYRGSIDSAELYQIRMGGWTYKDVIEHAEDLLATAKRLGETANIPEQPDKERIRELCRHILMEHLNGNRDGPP